MFIHELHSILNRLQIIINNTYNLTINNCLINGL